MLTLLRLCPTAQRITCLILSSPVLHNCGTTYPQISFQLALIFLYLRINPQFLLSPPSILLLYLFFFKPMQRNAFIEDIPCNHLLDLEKSYFTISFLKSLMLSQVFLDVVVLALFYLLFLLTINHHYTTRPIATFVDF